MSYALSTVRSSSSAQEARSRVLSLYRAWMRETPTITDKYQLDIPMSQVRAKIREEFKKNAQIKDVRVVDLLVFKGKQELDETHWVWKQKTHIMRYWQPDDNDPTKMDFLTRFYKGKA
eukprot:comp24514_c0_seq1/m.46765 comp24514_c0_seq1/g.46765  ORF comp24514_c0_seq1/g.46765 comp24514_c0_seq1/m.46765 type:complete len:118 (-) comp24514_c0_seq1:152-505(-)